MMYFARKVEKKRATSYLGIFMSICASFAKSMFMKIESLILNL